MVLQGWKSHSHARCGESKNYKILYNLQMLKIRKEGKPKRLSWDTYSALEGKRVEWILHHYSWMNRAFCGQDWVTPPLRLAKTCIKQQDMLAEKC
jgi:hypothetical protein